MDLNNHPEVKNMMRYRFFGTEYPTPHDVNIFLDYDCIVVEEYCDADKIYMPVLKLHRKMFFEYKKYQYKVISKKMEFELIWASPETLFECFEAIIIGLKHAKSNYHKNCSRTKAREAAKAAKAAKEARKRAEEEQSEDDQSHNHNQRLRRKPNVCFCLHSFYISDLRVCIDNKQESKEEAEDTTDSESEAASEAESKAATAEELESDGDSNETDNESNAAGPEAPGKEAQKPSEGKEEGVAEEKEDVLVTDRTPKSHSSRKRSRKEFESQPPQHSPLAPATKKRSSYYPFRSPPKKRVRIDDNHNRNIHINDNEDSDDPEQVNNLYFFFLRHNFFCLSWTDSEL